MFVLVLFWMVLPVSALSNHTSNNVFHFPLHSDDTGEFDTIYEKNISSSDQYSWIFTYVGDHKVEPGIRTWVDYRADLSSPVMFEVRHHLSQSWTLPVLIGNNMVYRHTNKTVCTPPFDLDPVKPVQRSIQVIVSTKSEQPVGFSLSLSLDNIHIHELNKKTIVSVSPTSPAYLKLGPLTDISSPYVRIDVSLLVETNPLKTPACFTFSIQSPSCPVQEEQSNVQYYGISHTISTITAISVSREDVKDQEKFLVLVMHRDYSMCNSSQSQWQDQLLRVGQARVQEVQLLDESRQLQLVIRESASQSVYLSATLGVSAVILVLCLLFVFVYLRWLEDGLRVREECGDGWRRNSNFSSSTYNLCFVVFHVKDHTSRSNVSLEEACSKPPEQISKSVHRYCATFWVVSLFYVIPVVQFVLLYQRVLNKTGNEDLCYFNFRCLHPAGRLTAFNHIFSNVAYVMLGILFLLIVGIASGRRSRRPELNDRGLFQHNGIYYAMGSALVMEGLMSSFYHVCPTHLNFQFDTCFMYIMAMLSLVKIYQSRHPDSNASAVMAFLGIALVVFMGVVTAIYQVWWLWMIITMIHIGASFMFSVHLYSWGDWRFGSNSDLCDGEQGKQELSLSEKCQNFLQSFLFPFRPLKEPITGMLVTLNVLNWTVAVIGHVMFYKSQDIASYLLVLFLLNMTVYVGMYVTLKLWVANERIPWPSWIYFGISLPFWIAGLVLFFKLTSTWDRSQAESRELNEECVFLSFYDYHDIWHFLSAFGMFFLFMFLFTMDDGLKERERSRIKVF